MNTRLQQSATPTAPISVGVTVAVGPWQITVDEVVDPETAASVIASTNDGNQPAPEGLQYLLIRITAQNMSQITRPIQLVDFAAAGDDRILRRPPSIAVPDPALQSVVKPGESADGWVPVLVSNNATATLRFDSALANSTWARATFALGDAAPATTEPGPEESDAGSDPASPAAVGDAVRTGGFEVTVQDILYGQDLFDRTDSRVRALGSGYEGIPLMVGVYVRVTNVGAHPAYFSTSAMQIADPEGTPWDHTLALTPPEPDISQEFLPGASAEGWAAFELQPYGSTDLLRVLPFAIGGSPRYVAFTGDGIQNDPPTDTASVEPLDVTVGDTVRTSEDLVNLRSEPSADGDIVAELPLHTGLTITGEGVDADNYTWFPVAVIEREESGFVVQDFLEPV